MKPAEAGFVVYASGDTFVATSIDPKRFAGLQAMSKMFIAMAGRVSHISDSFSNWLAIALGAILSLLVSNIDKLVPYIEIQLIKRAAILYFISIVLVLIQKFLSILISSASNGSSIAQEHAQEIVASGIDVHEFFDLMLSASVPPGKWLM